ncbi:MAG TPA: hypothetical protein VKS60_00285 [Stellaceae bacterium]|nr:hypothetical protein [Stellaceae bacterium]
MFIPLRKADSVQRLVYGRIDETPDRAGEIFDYTSSKPEIERWSNDLAKASGGRSLGNVRAMHQLKAAGILTGLSFDDKSRAIEFCAHIVDDEEWQKIEAGVYTGFSPGGRKRFLDATRTRYTAFPSEISLVDLPCIPSATFTLVKADGAEVVRGFAATEPSDEALAKALSGAGSRRAYRGIVLALPADRLGLFETAADLPLAKRDFSAAERRKLAAIGHAMPDGSFPIESRGDVEDAVHDWGRAGSSAAVKSHIIRRARAIGAEEALPKGWAGAADPADEADLGDLARDHARTGDQAVAQRIHDRACALGASCGMAKASGMGDLARLAFELASAREDLAKAAGIADGLRTRLAELERQPLPGGPVLYSIERGGARDTTGEALAKAESLPAATQSQQLARATALTRLALVTPQPAARNHSDV